MYGLSQVEYAAWETIGVQEDTRPAFQARVKYLRRLGLLPNPGAGVRIPYSFDQAFELICALNLQDAGVSPVASIATAHAAQSRLGRILDGDENYILLIEKEPSRFVSISEARSMIGTEVLFSFLDLKLLALKIQNALTQSVSRPKIRQPRMSRKSLAEHIYGERDGS